MNAEKDINPYLVNLIVSHEAAAMQFMGKTTGADGKVERNLEMARFAIDTLQAIQEKTQGNLTVDEKKLLDHALYQLRLNYVDEAEAEKNRAAQPQDETEGDKASTPESEEQPTGEKPDNKEEPPAKEAK
jgi:heme-binding NEAT domain protein